MNERYITHCYLRGTDSWQNIMHLPEKEAFRKAKELAKEHEWKTSVGRFMDFQRYYPLRKGADKAVREAFTRLGGHPGLAYPSVQVCGSAGVVQAGNLTEQRSIPIAPDTEKQQENKPPLSADNPVCRMGRFVYSVR